MVWQSPPFLRKYTYLSQKIFFVLVWSSHNRNSIVLKIPLPPDVFRSSVQVHGESMDIFLEQQNADLYFPCNTSYTDGIQFSFWLIRVQNSYSPSFVLVRLNEIVSLSLKIFKCFHF